MELKRILHVDDDEDIRTIVQIALEVVGNFEIRQCADGRSAILIAQEFKPDLLLLDVMMPEMSGQDVKAALSELPGMKDVRAIFMTAKAEDEFTRGLREDGALAVITKPFDPMALPEQIRTIWRQATCIQHESVAQTL